ncbi:hypothetical protein [Reyranella sp.]|uniref:hypothetical protein n=1 Tax=Reyranella sp. TaxID=1929291 RepID=UPI003D129DFF
MADIIGDDEPQPLTGTEDSDFLWGMGGFDQLFGLGGDDVYLLTDAFALVGFDVVVEAAGAGTDTVIVQRAAAPGGLGLSYTLTANVENGTIGGVDTLPPEVLGVPPDAPFTLIGNALDNILTGNRADNTLEGRDGADVLDGKLGSDLLVGGTGDDTYILLDVTFPVLTPTAAPELVIPVLTPSYDGVTEAAGGGTDTVLVARAGTGTNVPTSYALGANVENGIIGGIDSGLTSDLAFSLSGNELDNSLTGNRADNTLTGNAGADVLNGGSGLDTLIGGTGDDTYLLLDVTFPLIILLPTAAPELVIPALTPSYDAVTEAAGGGTDTVIVDLIPGTNTPRSYTLGANIENGIVAGVDTGQPVDLPFSLVGNALDNSLTGNNGTNTLSGGDGADFLNGKFGLDTLIGGAGDDLYFLLDVTTSLVGTPFPTELVTEYDIVTEAADGGTDTVVVDLIPGGGTPRSYTLGANIENGIVAGVDTGQPSDLPFSLVGNALDNVLTGNGGGNTLSGGGGADILDGRFGLDTLVGGAGDDLYLVLDATTTLEGAPIPQFVTKYDEVIEEAGGGIDTVLVARAVALHALTSYTLGANVENGIIGGVDSGQATDEAFSLAGNSLVNTLIGNAANNVLDGKAGADAMVGGAGNDTYTVDNAGDIVIENNGDGADQVNSSVSFDLSGQFIERLTLTGSANINGTGNTLANTLTGNAANNILDGKTGADTMVGGAGNDTYTVDNAGDRVIEKDGQGLDQVDSSVSFDLTGQYIERLTLTGSGNINGAGNSLANTLTGNAGNNVLDGKTGADRMTGGAGNDTYTVDNAGDVVVEKNGEGTDLVNSSVSFDLTGQYIERLTLTGSSNINGAGNSLANTLTGNAGNNVLDGKTGVDTMAGGTGNDTYMVDIAGDTVTENDGEGTDQVISSVGFDLTGQYIERLTLTGSANINGRGNTLDNTLIGNAGNNVLDGRAGADVLTGGLGADIFVFGSSLHAPIVDTITDFNVAADTIRLDNAVFDTIVGTGTLSLAQFTANASGTAQDASDRIIYETDTGKLFFDSNGSAAGGSIQFAKLGAGLALTNADFVIV